MKSPIGRPDRSFNPFVESILEQVTLRRSAWLLIIGFMVAASVLQYIVFAVPPFVVIASVAVLLFTTILIPLIPRLKTRFTAVSAIAGAWAFGSIGMLATGGVESPMVWTLGVVIVFAGLIAQSTGLVLSFGLSLLTLVGLWYGEGAGWIDVQYRLSGADEYFVDIVLQFVAFAVIMWLFVRSLAGSIRRAQAEIEERKETERSLTRRERQLMMSLHAGKIGVWEWDFRSNTMTWSDKVDAILGLTPGALGTTFEGFLKAIVPEDRAFVQKEFRRVLNGDIHELFVNPRICLEDGTRRWLEGKGSILWDGGGAAVGMMGTVMDITERANAQVTLRRSEMRFRSLVQRSNDVILVCDTAGRCVFISPSIVSVMGYREEDCLGRTIFEFIHPDDEHRARAVYGELLSHGAEGKAHETRLRHADGSYRTLETVGMNLLDQPEINGLLITARDVTERKKEEASIEAIAAGVSATTGESFFRSMVEHLAQALEVEMVLIGERDPECGTIVRSEAVWKDGRWSANFRYDLTGSVCETVVGKSVQVFPRGVTRLFPNDTVLMEHGFESFAGIPLGVPDGSIMGILAVFSRRPIQNVERVRSFLQILAARAAAELERTRSEERLKASLREKEVLLKEIHHRVKNNLQVVSSLLNLQSEFVEDPGMKALIRESQGRIRSMGLVHENLYRTGDLARIRAQDYLRSIVISAQRSYNLPHVRVSIEADDLLLGMDEAVPVGLIVNELVSNSMKHAFPDGKRGSVEVGLRGFEHGAWRLTVADDGKGLPAGVASGANGSLGLQLVNTLVHQLAGVLVVDGTQGARFVVTFTPLER